MMPLLTCKQFLEELSEYLDENLDPEAKAALEKHISECPNCFVVCDTTKKTIRVYRGMDSYPMPGDVEKRLMAALEKKMAAKAH
jgi:anti-sigma factor RsiW